MNETERLLRSVRAGRMPWGTDLERWVPLALDLELLEVCHSTQCGAASERSCYCSPAPRLRLTELALGRLERADDELAEARRARGSREQHLEALRPRLTPEFFELLREAILVVGWNRDMVELGFLEDDLHRIAGTPGLPLGDPYEDETP